MHGNLYFVEPQISQKCLTQKGIYLITERYSIYKQMKKLFITLQGDFILIKEITLLKEKQKKMEQKSEIEGKGEV